MKVTSMKHINTDTLKFFHPSTFVACLYKVLYFGDFIAFLQTAYNAYSDMRIAMDKVSYETEVSSDIFRDYAKQQANQTWGIEDADLLMLDLFINNMEDEVEYLMKVTNKLFEFEISGFNLDVYKSVDQNKLKVLEMYKLPYITVNDKPVLTNQSYGAMKELVKTYKLYKF